MAWETSWQVRALGQFDLVKSQRFFEPGEMFPVVVNQQGGDIMTKSSIVLFCAL